MHAEPKLFFDPSSYLGLVTNPEITRPAHLAQRAAAVKSRFRAACMPGQQSGLRSSRVPDAAQRATLPPQSRDPAKWRDGPRLSGAPLRAAPRPGTRPDLLDRLRFDPAQRAPATLCLSRSNSAVRRELSMSTASRPYPVVQDLIESFGRLAEAPPRDQRDASARSRRFRPDRERLADRA